MARLLWIACAAIMTHNAHAQSGGRNTYVSVGGTWGSPDALDIFGPDESVGAHTTMHVGRDSGLGLLAAVGRRFAGRMSGEIGLGYLKTDLKQVRNRGGIDEARRFGLPAIVPVTGGVTTWSLTVNAYYAFRGERVSPYIGVGVGVSSHDVSLDALNVPDFDLALGSAAEVGKEELRIDGPGYSARDRAGQIQLMAGLDIPVGAGELLVGYRYTTGEAIDLDGAHAEHAIKNVDITYRFKW